MPMNAAHTHERQFHSELPIEAKINFSSILTMIYPGWFLSPQCKKMNNLCYVEGCLT